MAPSKARREAPPTSKDLDDFSVELAHAGDREALLKRISTVQASIRKKLTAAELELVEVTGRAAKKNHAQRLSESIAQKVANALRKEFPGIQPDEDGGGHESFSKGAGGLKKIDVNYSTKKSGLELAISVKTINFVDEKTKRYTKNVKRVDGELRAEAQDCHRRQPFAVIAAFLFMPSDSMNDGAETSKSSARHAAEVLSSRSGRSDPRDGDERLECAFMGFYDLSGVVFAPPEDVPERGVPKKSLGFREALAVIRARHSARNKR